MPLESLLRKDKALHQFNAQILISDGLEQSGNVCCGQMSQCFSLFLEENAILGVCRPTRFSPATGAKANICPAIEVHQFKGCG